MSLSLTPETLQRAIEVTKARLLALLREAPTPSINSAILFESDRLSTLRDWAAASRLEPLQETQSAL